MNKSISNIPAFEVNGNVYTFARNRYLLAEFDAMREEDLLTPQEEQQYAIAQEKYSRIEKLSERVQELENKYYETFSEEDGAIYERAKAQFDKLYRELLQFESETGGISKKLENAALTRMENLVLVALQINDKGENIRSKKEATDIWCSFVDKVGKQGASEWLIYATNYITGADEEEENPFVAQAKARAEQRANNRKAGLKKIK